MKVKSQLEAAQLENLTSDPSTGTKGRIWHNTTSGLSKFDDGSAVRTVVTLDNTQTLTNKTINAIGNGSANQVLYLDGSKNLATESALSASRGGTSFSSYTTGDLLYASGAAALSKLGIGSSGQFLGVSGGLPVWTSAAATLAVTSKSANYTAVNTDNVILCDDSGASFTITLYAAASNAGKQLIIKKTVSSTNSITIDGNASETIDGATTTTINTQYESITILCDGSNWHIIDRKYISELSLTPSYDNMTVANTNYVSLRLGAFLDMEGYFSVSSVTGATWALNLPTGYAIDSAKLSSGTQGTVVGYFYRSPDAAANIPTTSAGAYPLFYDGSTTGKIFIATAAGSTAGTLSKALGSFMNGGTGERGNFHFRIPISGWKS